MALPLGKLTIIVGAGIVGSVLAKEGRFSNVSDFFSGAFKIVWKHIQQDDSQSTKPTSKPQNDSLLAQVNSLRQELQLLASSRSVTIVTGNGSGGRTYGMPVVVIVGVVGYGYVWWKGWKFSDMMFVTRRGLSDACTTVAKELEKVSSSVWAAKRHLSSRIDRLDDNLDECGAISAATRDEVSQLRGDLRGFGVDFESVQHAVQNLETKIGRIEGKQDFTNEGVLTLCDFVYMLEQSRNQSRNPEHIEASSSTFHTPARELPPSSSMSRTVSLPPRVPELEPPSPSTSNGTTKVSRPLLTAVSASGLKDLRVISDANEVADSEVSHGPVVAEEPNSNGSSSSGRSGYRWKVPGLNAPFFTRTHSAMYSFK
eukprot:TRINITY_DN3170_c0_g2_i2.p1 TRINITY_DN3170_c0_g2~~TRINITY_DN3170_c0_g2_i2.p1  ORF type:complete len:370 (-),score=68.58 TRINITY_DN3170_c0_g2_i2:20-1129(-)